MPNKSLMLPPDAPTEVFDPFRCRPDEQNVFPDFFLNRKKTILFFRQKTLKEEIKLEGSNYSISFILFLRSEAESFPKFSDLLNSEKISQYQDLSNIKYYPGAPLKKESIVSFTCCSRGFEHLKGFELR